MEIWDLNYLNKESHSCAFRTHGALVVRAHSPAFSHVAHTSVNLPQWTNGAASLMLYRPRSNMERKVCRLALLLALLKPQLYSIYGWTKENRTLETQECNSTESNLSTGSHPPAGGLWKCLFQQSPKNCINNSS